MIQKTDENNRTWLSHLLVSTECIASIEIDLQLFRFFNEALRNKLVINSVIDAS